MNEMECNLFLNFNSVGQVARKLRIEISPPDTRNIR